MTTIDKREVLVEAVRSALATNDGSIRDGRKGLALKRNYLASKFESWGKNGYYLNLQGDNQLSSTVYRWCESNGLKAEADAFNAQARAQYWYGNAAWWIRKRAELRVDLAMLEQNIEKYMPRDFWLIQYKCKAVSASEYADYEDLTAGEDLDAMNYVIVGENGCLYNATLEKHDARVGVSYQKGEFVVAFVNEVQSAIDENTRFLVRER